MMDDKTFDDLKLKATICPKQPSWPAPEHVHWQKLHAAADAARSAVATAYSQMAKVDADKRLSKEGKVQRRHAIAKQMVAEIEKSTALTKARAAVDRVMQQWAAKAAVTIKPAADVAEATVHAHVRDRVASMKTGRMAWLEKHAADPVVASAILTAPQALSDLTDTELAMVRSKAERVALSAEVAEAKAATELALQEVERGWRHAPTAIAQRAGLTKGPDGTWRDPSMSEAA